MRRCLATAVVGAVLVAGQAQGQVLDETLVPRGHLRLQAHPVFSTWDSRYGRSAGIDAIEPLGQDLTDPTGYRLFPGLGTLTGLLEEVTGMSGYTPSVGSTEGRVRQDVTRVDLGAQLGVFDWLTLGVVVPWVETRSAIEYVFVPDTVGGAALGLSPTITDASAVTGYLDAVAAASSSAQASAASACAAGPSPACTAAQALADRTAGFDTSIHDAYAASPFYPMAGTTMALALAQVTAALDADLVGAGLPGLAAPMPFATQVMEEGDLRNLPVTPGGGLDGFPLWTRRGLWGAGDAEVSALVRVAEHVRLDSLGSQAGLSYSLTVGVLARLPTGTPENPDIFLDSGTGDRQTDFEGRITAALAIGPVGLAVGGRYGVQGKTTLTRRVAAPEVAMPPVSTRELVEWEPGSYVRVEVAPTLRLSDELAISGAYRYFGKATDSYTLVDPTSSLDPSLLARETGMRLHQIGIGLRYSTVQRWRSGWASRPMELHLRFVRAVAGSGGQTPVVTRIEAGVRLFKRFWGPPPTR